MAIRIKDKGIGSLTASAGKKRLTYPVGTYLPSAPTSFGGLGNPFSQPTTASVGPLGAGAPQIPSAPVTANIPGQRFGVQYVGEGGALQTRYFNTPGTVQAATPWGAALMNYYYGTAQPQVSNAQAASGSTPSALSPSIPGIPNLPSYLPTLKGGEMNPPTNELVGKNPLGENPNFLSYNAVRQILPGKSAEEIIQYMTQKGYKLVVERGHKTFVFTGETPQQQPSRPQTDERGRLDVNPFEIGPQLERGERVVTTGGFGVTGGATAPGGEAQYAVTLPGRGDRWKYRIQRDAAGNWVRIYYRTFGGPNRRTRARRAEAAAAAAQPATEQPVFHQLVNLRVNYG